MSRHNPVIAISGMEGRDNPYPGAPIARALRAARGDGVVLVGLTYDPCLTGCFRRDLFDRVYTVPFPSDPPASLERRLEQIHGEFPLDGIIPALDTEVPVYARRRAWLAQRGIRSVLPPERAVKVRYKDRLEAWCRSNGAYSPRTDVVSDPYKYFDGTQMAFPLFVKGGLADAIHASTREEAIAAYWKLAAKWGFPILSQEPVTGEEFDVCAVAGPGGDVVTMVTIRKTAISRAGKALGGVFVDDAGANEAARHIIKQLKWEGPLELELVREDSSGRFFLIEINSRFPAWIAATIGCGVNLPDVLVRMMLGEPLPAVRTARAGTAFMRTSRTTLSRVEDLGTLLATGRLVHERTAGPGRSG